MKGGKIVEEFKKIYEENCNEIFLYIMSLCGDRYLAEEIVQETFYRAIKNIDSFRGDCKLVVWLCQIAKNIYFTKVQKNKRFVHDESAFDDDGYNVDSSFEEKLVEKETVIQIQRYIHELKEPYKEVVYMHLFGEMTFERVAEIFGKSASWAKMTYYRGKKMIMEKMEHN